MARLLDRDVRRQRRHFGIGLRINDDRAIRTQRFAPCDGNLFGIVETNALESQHFGICRRKEIPANIAMFQILDHRSKRAAPK